MRNIKDFIHRWGLRFLSASFKQTKIRNIFLGNQFAYLDPTASVSSEAIIYGAQNISIGPYVSILPYVMLRCSPWLNIHQLSGSIEVGEGTVIQPFANLFTDEGIIKIGKRCSVNQYCMLSGQGGLIIGDDVRIGLRAAIIPTSHMDDLMDDLRSRLKGIEVKKRHRSTQLGINIGHRALIGAGAMILDGVNIAEGSAIGAGSVVTESTEPYGVYVGIPARKIKTLKCGEDIQQ